MHLKNQYLGFVQSTSLWIDETLFNIPVFDHTSLSKNDIPLSVSQISIKENEVLGKRIERFFEHYITNSDRYTLLSQNIQIFRNKITIGELDFILRDHITHSIIHLELVYKFYLYDPDITVELERWIGPNRNDTLIQKVHKLKTKQFPLLYEKETQLVLQQMDINPENIAQQVCYMGNLFVPFSLKNTQLPYINNQCVVGFWISSKQFFSKHFTSSYFNIPKKKDWIINPKYCTTWYTYSDIEKEVQASLIQKKSPLLWMKSNGDSYERFFVVWW